MWDTQKLKRIDREFHHIAKRLDRLDLQQQGPGSLGITNEDIFSDLVTKSSDNLFLGFYTEEGIRTALEHYGIVKQVRKRGLGNFLIRIDTSDPYQHRMRLYCDGAESPETLLYDTKMRLIHRPGEYDFERELGDAAIDFLYIDWINLQNPKAAFHDNRPPLPGQQFPGLGIGYEILELMQIMAERLGLAGIINVPMHYHNAYLYHIRYHFIDPEMAGRFMALVRDLSGLPLATASWAVEKEAVWDQVEERYIKWAGREQLFPLRRRVQRYFETADYARRRDRSAATNRFKLDAEKLAREIKNEPFDLDLW